MDTNPADLTIFLEDLNASVYEYCFKILRGLLIEHYEEFCCHASLPLRRKIRTECIDVRVGSIFEVRNHGVRDVSRCFEVGLRVGVYEHIWRIGIDAWGAFLACFSRDICSF